MRGKRLLTALVFGIFLLGMVSATVIITNPTDTNYDVDITDLTFDWSGSVVNDTNKLDYTCWADLNGDAREFMCFEEPSIIGYVDSIEGNNTWSVFVNDSGDNTIESDTVSFWVDSIDPNLTYVNPSSNIGYTNSNSLDLILNLLESNSGFYSVTKEIKRIFYYPDGISQHVGAYDLDSNNDSDCSHPLTNLDDQQEGNYSWESFAKDIFPDSSLRKEISLIGTIIRDTLIPSVQITSPSNGSKWRSSVSISSNAWDNTSATDDVSGIDTITNNIYNSSDDVANSTSCIGEICSYQWDSTSVDDGLYYIIATAIDRATNSANSSQIFFDIDNTAPIVNFNSPSNGTITNESISVNISASDTHLSNLILMNDSTNLNTTIALLDFLESIILLEDEGEYFLTAWANDTFGNNDSTSPAVELIIDKTAPEVNAGANNITNTTLTRTGTASDSLSGIDYTLWSEATNNITFTAPSSLTTNMDATQDGVYTIQLLAVDNAGNSDTSEFTLTWDATPPTTDDDYDDTWRNSAFDITLNATDETSGVDYIMWNYNNSTWNKNFTDEVIVHVNLEGNLTLKYYAVDEAGNANAIETIDVLIDGQIPIVNAGNDINTSTQTNLFGNVFDDGLSPIISWLWSSVTNVFFGNANAQNTTINATVDGIYNIDLRVNDSAGNEGIDSLTFRWDTTAPNLTLIENATLTLEAKQDNYTEYGATAVDTYDGDRTSNISITGSVNTNVINTYIVTYSVSDSLNNINTTTRTVNVVDTTIPVITLLGSSPIDVDVGTTYSDAGATALDNYDGDITASIVTINSVNTSIVGPYTVTYDIADSSANIATQVTRTVNVVDETDPSVTLDSPTDGDHFAEGTTIVEINYTATDTSNNITSCDLTLNNVLNQTTPNDNDFVLSNLSSGKYTYKVSCTDGSSNTNTSTTQSFTILSSLSEVSEFDDYTNLTAEADISNVSSFFVNNSLGSVEFLETIDFSSGVDWSTYFNISQDRIEVITNADLDLNKQMTLTFQNINYTTPEVLKDGVVFTTYTNWNYNTTTDVLTFETNQAGVYTIREYVAPVTQSGGSSGGGGSSSTTYYECSEWNECGAGSQSRTCEKVNYCTILEENCYKTTNQPEESQSCTMPVEELSTGNDEDDQGEDEEEPQADSGRGFLSLTGDAIGNVTDFAKSPRGIFALIFAGLILIGGTIFTFRKKIMSKVEQHKKKKYKFDRKK
jgi:Bacterial surface protein, Ig-like domain/Bacterial Ig domain